MVLFQSVQVPVKGTDNYEGAVFFDQPIVTADVALRGIGLTGYEDGSEYHFRGPTIVEISNVSVVGTGVKFKFKFDFSENPSYQMVGNIDFLVIANPPE